jgi:hypothetical protein
MATYNGIQIYDETNYQELVKSTVAAGGAFGSGLNPESEQPGFGALCETIEYGNVPRSEWKDRIEYAERMGLFPEAWFKRGEVPVLSQKNYGFCWMYGVVGAMQCAYAMTGIKSPKLNAFYPAYLGKNGRNQGGWGGEALEYIERYGVPEWGVFPDQPTNRAMFERQEVKASAELHKVVKFRELQRNSFPALMNMWLSDNPRPVSQAYNWWGHLVYAIRPVVIGANSFGTLIVNSWDYSWGNNGVGIIAEAKASAAEQICVDVVTTVAA